MMVPLGYMGENQVRRWSHNDLSALPSASIFQIESSI